MTNERLKTVPANAYIKEEVPKLKCKKNTLLSFVPVSPFTPVLFYK